jgi:hypothetical protein
MTLAAAVAAGFGGCTPAQAPAMRTSGKVMALGGVAGIVGAAFATNLTDKAGEMLIGFEVISAVGVLTYAYAELTWPKVSYPQETVAERNHRWAKILTERASGAAREGRCARVRRLEVRVQKYDREIHDFVLMKDAEIVKCLAAPAGADPMRPTPSSESPPPAEATPTP